MPKTKQPRLNDRHRAVLSEIEKQGGALWCQLTQGPLRHCSAVRRQRVMRHLQDHGLVEAEDRKPKRGRTAPFYRNTPAGRAVIESASGRPGSLASSSRSAARN